MAASPENPFLDLDAAALAAYADEKAGELGLALPDAYRPAVLDTLAGLQQHARIVRAALRADDP
jgi:hypothetical protein